MRTHFRETLKEGSKIMQRTVKNERVQNGGRSRAKQISKLWKHTSKKNAFNTLHLAYYAGFLDGDGCINAQIVPRVGYRLGFQIRVSLTFFQSTKREWFFLRLAKIFPQGTYRRRKDGVSEYAIVGTARVFPLCKKLLPFLQIKRKQASLLLQISRQLKKNQDPNDFLALCRLVDQIGKLNDSKKRVISTETVQAFFLAQKGPYSP